MHDTTGSAGLAPGDQWQERDALSLDQLFEQISDEGPPRGKRYSLALVLSLLIVGKLAGMTTLTAMAAWVRWRADWLHQVLPATRAQVPCPATASNVGRAVDTQPVTPRRASWLTRLEATRRGGTEPRRLLSQPEAREPHLQVARDGKTGRATLAQTAPDQRSHQVVALDEPQTGMVLAQHAVPDTGNAITLSSDPADPGAGSGADRDRRCEAHPEHVVRGHAPLRWLVRAARQGQPAPLGGAVAPLLRRTSGCLP